MNNIKSRKSDSGESKAMSSVLADRSLRKKLAMMRTKFVSVKWDGMCGTFKIFIKTLEGHLLQVVSGYMTQLAFIQVYKN